MGGLFRFREDSIDHVKIFAGIYSDVGMSSGGNDHLAETIFRHVGTDILPDLRRSDFESSRRLVQEADGRPDVKLAASFGLILEMLDQLFDLFFVCRLRSSL